MILIDKSGHMVSTDNVEELHRFAEWLGLRRSWFQLSVNFKRPHYDLTTKRMIKKAISMGAKEVSGRELIERAFWRKEKNETEDL